MAMRHVVVALVIVTGTACASRSRDGIREFGDGAMAREQFHDLDSALSRRVGRELRVDAQESSGQFGPVSHGAARLGFRRFQGTLLPANHQWVALYRGPGDTVRVGKGHVVGIWEMRESVGTEGILLGALGFGIGAFYLLEARSDNPSSQVRIGITLGSAVVGALLGRMIQGGQRPGDQVYPLRRAP